MRIYLGGKARSVDPATAQTEGSEARLGCRNDGVDFFESSRCRCAGVGRPAFVGIIVETGSFHRQYPVTRGVFESNHSAHSRSVAHLS